MKSDISPFARRTRLAIKWLVALAALMLAAWSARAFWLYENDPLSILASPQTGLEARTAELGSRNGRRTVHIVLPSDRLGDIGLAISFPEPLPARKLPVLIVLGGLGTGEENIDYLKGMGDNILVGYDWPLPAPFPRIDSLASQMDLVSRIPDLYRRVMHVPSQVASAIDWIVGQDWADNKRISLLGFSLGALALPAAEDVAEHSGVHIGWTIIAYGGAPLGGVLASATANLKRRRWYFGLFPPLVDKLLGPLQPTLHLPALQSRFLVLEGQDDERFPEALRRPLREAVPEPKDVIVLEGAHLGLDPKKLALLDHAIDASKHWLIDSGAADAPQEQQ